MSDVKQLILLAEYNQLMNQRQYESAERLTDEQLSEDRGAFFKSILGTLNHILVGDLIWLRRFAEHPSSTEVLSPINNFTMPKSLDAFMCNDFRELRAGRENVDAIIVKWVNQLSEKDMEGCISYSNMAGNTFSKSFLSLIHHLFLHQVHHRGQVTALLSQLGVDFGETDLVEIINQCDK